MKRSTPGVPTTWRVPAWPAALLLMVWCSVAWAEDAKQPANSYARPNPSPVPMAFMPLPPGQVTPRGWLRDWCERERDGLGGHLDELSKDPVFVDGWKGVPIAGRRAGARGEGWPLEQCGYWLDGLTRLALVMHDEALLKKARERLDPVVTNLKADGPFIWWRADWPGGFDAWGCAVLGRALVACYAGTRDPKVLACLEHAYRPFPRQGGFSRGTVNLESMLEAYSWGADKKLLDNAQACLEDPRSVQTVTAWRAGNITPDHGVTYNELSKLPALAYPWFGKKEYLEASVQRYEWLEKNHMQPYGVNSAQEGLAGISAFAHTETCDVSDYIWSSLWLYRITGKCLWGDRIERAFLNAGAATLSRDGLQHVYYQAPNRLSRTVPPKPGPGGSSLYQTTHGVLCCSGDVHRILPNYVIHMWMATPDGGLAFALLGPCEAEATVAAGVKVKLACETDYPFGETLLVKLQPEAAARFPLYVRLPAWCAKPALAVNGEAVACVAGENGFAKIEREWKPGDVLRLDLPMACRVLEGKETRGAPFASVYYGPLLFALPLAETDPNTVDPAAKWNFALAWDRGDPAKSLKLVRAKMPEKWDWPLQAPLTLAASGVEFDWPLAPAKPALPAEAVPSEGAKTRPLQLIPYGCAKFRVSMFPVAK